MKKFLLKFVQSLACLAAMVFPSNAARGDGLIGTDLKTAETKNDLFVFFNFAPIETEEAPSGASLISYKPTGEAFRALVTLKITVDRLGKIRKLRLEIARSFINDRAKSIYAADLAKSFLGAAAKTGPGDDIQALATEITARSQAGSSATILTRQPPTPLSRTPSRAYQTYAGGPSPATLDYPRGLQLHLRNDNQGAVPVLIMSVGSEK